MSRPNTAVKLEGPAGDRQATRHQLAHPFLPGYEHQRFNLIKQILHCGACFGTLDAYKAQQILYFIIMAPPYAAEQIAEDFALILEQFDKYLKERTTTERNCRGFISTISAYRDATLKANPGAQQFYASSLVCGLFDWFREVIDDGNSTHPSSGKEED